MTATCKHCHTVIEAVTETAEQFGLVLYCHLLQSHPEEGETINSNMAALGRFLALEHFADNPHLQAQRRADAAAVAGMIEGAADAS